MAIKFGLVTDHVKTQQLNNTVDIAVDVFYSDLTTASSVKIADDVVKLTPTRAKSIIVPLNSTTFSLASDPDTEFATGYVRTRVTTFT